MKLAKNYFYARIKGAFKEIYTFVFWYISNMEEKF